MTRFVSACCEGERCWCGAPAEHKVEGRDQVILGGAFHELTAYVCHAHFRQLMGPAAGE